MNLVILQYRSPRQIVSAYQDSLICGPFNRTTTVDEVPGCIAFFTVVWELT